MTRLCAVVVVVLGLLNLLAWQVAPDLLIARSPGRLPMLPLTSLAFSFAGLCLWLRTLDRTGSGQLASWLSWALTAFAVATLAEYLFGWSLGIDRLLGAASGALPSQSFPERPSPNAALTLALAGLALANLDAPPARRRVWPGEVFALGAAVLPYLALLGYAYDLEFLIRLSPYIGLALPTSVIALVLVVGTLLARPERGVVALFLAPGSAGLLLRRTLPAALLLPPLLGWLQLTAGRGGLFEPALGEAALVLGLTFLVLDGIARSAVALRQLDRDRRTACLQLERVNDEVQDLYDHAPCGYHSLDAQGRLVAINATALGWLGYRAEELMGRPFASLLTPTSLDTFQQHFDTFKRQGWVQDLEFELRTRDGRLLPILLSATAIRDETGGYVSSRSTWIDLSERKRLEASTSALAAIVESSTDAIFVRDLQGRVASWNAGAERIFGYSAGEIQGASVAKLVPPEHHDQLDTAMAQIHHGERPATFETERLAKDGRRVPVLLTLSPVRDAHGKITGVSGIAHDISDFKRALETVARKAAELAKARELNRLKDHVLSTLSHELKTPMSLILGYAELIEELGAEPAMLAGIMDGTRRLSAHVDQILDYSALVTGTLVLHLSEVSLPEVVDCAQAGLATGFRACGVDLSVMLEPGLPTVRADSRRLTQVLVALLDNARKFTPAGGEASVRAAAGPDGVCISVCNTRPDLPAEVLAGMWEPFAQAAIGDADRTGGLGLGLTIVRALVEAQGGRIAATSEGGATCFMIDLPTAEPAPEPTITITHQPLPSDSFNDKLTQG